MDLPPLAPEFPVGSGWIDWINESEKRAVAPLLQRMDEFPAEQMAVFASAFVRRVLTDPTLDTTRLDTAGRMRKAEAEVRRTAKEAQEAKKAYAILRGDMAEYAMGWAKVHRAWVRAESTKGGEAEGVAEAVMFLVGPVLCILLGRAVFLSPALTDAVLQHTGKLWGVNVVGVLWICGGILVAMSPFYLGGLILLGLCYAACNVACNVAGRFWEFVQAWRGATKRAPEAWIGARNRARASRLELRHEVLRTIYIPCEYGGAGFQKIIEVWDAALDETDEVRREGW